LLCFLWAIRTRYRRYIALICLSTRQPSVRNLPLKLFAAVLLLGLGSQVRAIPPRKQSTPQPPLELRINGPSFIREGQAVKYKAVLINRSSEPVVLASPDSRLDFNLNSTITDPSGRPLSPKPFFFCPVGGKGWYSDLKRHMKDSDIKVLQPGEKLEFSFDDISDSYLFPGHGRYQVTFVYSYIPPQFEGHPGTPVDGFDAKYDLSDLSPTTIQALRQSVPITVSSKPSLMILQ